MDKLIDGPLIAGFQGAEGLLGRVLNFDEAVFIAAVGRGGNHIELRGTGGIIALEIHFLRAAGQIKTVLIIQGIHLIIRVHLPGAANVEHAAFAPFQEKLGTEVFPDVNALINGDLLLYRHDAQRNHPIHMAVDRHDLIGDKKSFNQKFLPGLLGGVALKITLVAGIPNIHDASSPF